MIDSHTHLDFCEPPNAELVAAASEAGVTRIVTVGTDGASCRAALAAAEDFPQVYAAIGRHPNEATGFDDADLAELEALAAHPQVRGDRRDRPRLLPRLRAARGSGAGVRGPDRARARHRQAARDPHPRGRRRHAGDAERTRAGGLHGDPPLLLDGRPGRRVPGARRLVDLVRRQRHLPQGATTCARRRCAFPPTGCWSRPTPRTCRRRPSAASPTSRPTWSTPRGRWRSSARVAYEELDAAIERSAAAVFGW